MTVSDLILKHEGLRLKPYTDVVGKITIGVGRNLTDCGISNEEAMSMFAADVAKAFQDVSTQIVGFGALNEVRQAVLTDMCFNMGITTLLQFKNTLAHVAAGEWDSAAIGMLASEWAKQVGPRAIELAQMMQTGEWPA